MLIFIGVIIENLFFELNNVLFLWVCVYVFKSFDEVVLCKLVGCVLNEDKGFGKCKLRLLEESFQVFLVVVDGDGWCLLNLLENVVDFVEDGSEISFELLQNLFGDIC